MKNYRRIIAIVLAVVLALACMTVPAMASKKSIKCTTTGAVNLRKGPGKNYGTITQIKKGVTLTATDYRKDNRGVYWVYVTYKGDDGWISTMNLKKGDGSGKKNKVTANDGSTYIRSKPGLNGKKLEILPHGSTATYLGKYKADERGVYWLKVSYKGTTGWVSSRYVVCH